MKKTKVLLVDDHLESRKVVKDFLASYDTVNIVGEAVEGNEVMKKVQTLIPDVVLMDISMPQRNGIEMTQYIKQRWPAIKVVIVTMHDNPVYRIQANEVRADGFILKSSFKEGLEGLFGARTHAPGMKARFKKHTSDIGVPA